MIKAFCICSLSALLPLAAFAQSGTKDIYDNKHKIPRQALPGDHATDIKQTLISTEKPTYKAEFIKTEELMKIQRGSGCDLKTTQSVFLSATYEYGLFLIHQPGTKRL